MSVYLLINNSLNLNKLNLIKCNSSALCRRIALCKKERLVLQKKDSKILFPSGKKIYYILVPMKISESIEAHLSAAVAAISQRNQATLPGFHKILISHVIKIFNRLAKASGFCLYFYSLYCHGIIVHRHAERSEASRHECCRSGSFTSRLRLFVQDDIGTSKFNIAYKSKL